MREKLKAIEGERLRFSGTVARFGKRTDRNGSENVTVLFCKVVRMDTGKEVTDHLWFNVGKRIQSLLLSVGDVVEFDATVVSYTKGYLGGPEEEFPETIDYRLGHPRNLEKIISA